MPFELPTDADSANANLLHAIKTDAAAAFDLALSRAASLEARDQYGNTAVMVAVRCERFAMVERLLAGGANVNALSLTCPHSALHIAAENDSLEMTGLLLRNGADPNVVGKSDRTPLHAACIAGKLPQVRLLLDRGATPTAVPGTGSASPLIAAILSNHWDIAAELLSRVPGLFGEFDSEGRHPLAHFAYWKSAETVAWLLKQPLPDWLKSNPEYFRDAAAEAVRELPDYEQFDGYEAARSATIELFRERGHL